MDLLTDYAESCIKDCLRACNQLGEANDLRFDLRDEMVFARDVFKTRISAAERALRRAGEALERLDGPPHGRVKRICHKAWSAGNELLAMLVRGDHRVPVDDKAAKLLRHCERALAR